jgi:hypothetical protein
MRRIHQKLAALLLLVACSADAATVVIRRSRGGGGGEPGCETQSLNVNFGPAGPGMSAGNQPISSSWAHGESYQYTTSGDAYSIWVLIDHMGGLSSFTATLRMGSSQSLESTFDREVALVVNSTGWKEFVFATTLAVSSGTQYYWAVETDNASNAFVASETDIYASGNRMNNNSDGSFNLSNQSNDVVMRASLCD